VKLLFTLDWRFSMRSFLFIGALLFANIAFAASNQTLLLNENFQTKNVQLNGPTFYNVSEDYTYNGTCYRNEPYEDTACFDVHDSTTGEWVNRCETTIRIREASYSCLQMGTRKVPYDDGGSSEAQISVSLKNAGAIEQPIEFNINMDQSNRGLGRKILFDADLPSDSPIFLKKLSTTQINGEDDGVFRMKGKIDLAAIEVSKIKEILNKKPVIENLTIDGLDIVIPSIVFDHSSFVLHFLLAKKKWGKYRRKSYPVKVLSKFKTIVRDDKTIVKIPFSLFSYFDKKKSGKYSIKATMQYSDENIIAPSRSSITGQEIEIKFKANFKKGTIRQ